VVHFCAFAKTLDDNCILLARMRFLRARFLAFSGMICFAAPPMPAISSEQEYERRGFDED
jgi:hypothetical protein